MNETRLKNNIVKSIKRKYPPSKIWVYKSSDRFTSGIPDLIICLEGKFVALEVKTSDGELSPIQKYTIDSINKSGGHAFEIRSVQEALLALQII